MKKLIVLFFVIVISVPVDAQFAVKGGITYAKHELSNYLLTGQFHKDLLVMSADVSIPTRNINETSYGGRMGIGFGGYRFRFAADIGAAYGNKNWRCGYGAEANLRLYGPIGMFTRVARTYPITQRGDHDEVLWQCKRSEISLGFVIELDGGCY